MDGSDQELIRDEPLAVAAGAAASSPVAAAPPTCEGCAEVTAAGLDLPLWRHIWSRGLAAATRMEALVGMHNQRFEVLGQSFERQAVITSTGMDTIQ